MNTLYFDLPSKPGTDGNGEEGNESGGKGQEGEQLK